MKCSGTYLITHTYLDIVVLKKWNVCYQTVCSALVLTFSINISKIWMMNQKSFQLGILQKSIAVFYLGLTSLEIRRIICFTDTTLLKT